MINFWERARSSTKWITNRFGTPDRLTNRTRYMTASSHNPAPHSCTKYKIDEKWNAEVFERNAVELFFKEFPKAMLDLWECWECGSNRYSRERKKTPKDVERNVIFAIVRCMCAFIIIDHVSVATSQQPWHRRRTANVPSLINDNRPFDSQYVLWFRLLVRLESPISSRVIHQFLSVPSTAHSTHRRMNWTFSFTFYAAKSLASDENFRTTVENLYIFFFKTGFSANCRFRWMFWRW